MDTTEEHTACTKIDHDRVSLTPRENRVIVEKEVPHALRNDMSSKSESLKKDGIQKLNKNGIIPKHVAPEGHKPNDFQCNQTDIHTNCIGIDEHSPHNVSCFHEKTDKFYHDKTKEITGIDLPNLSELSIHEENEPDILDGIEYVVYKSEHQMPDIMRLITKDLSEPYSIYTYRYFIHNWPKLCFLAMDNKKCVGAIVCKLDLHKKVVRRGYIAMLAVDKEYRRRKIGSHLVLKAISAMISDDCDEVVLETEITNKGALHLYENLGFVRDKRLFRYYLNGVDALRLKLWLR